MAHKTFISYKYSESRNLRDKIIERLGTDATYYKGETSDSPNLSDYKTDTIRKNLSDMIYDTTVMIVIVSPNMKQSEWMEWEIKYALRNQSRGGIYSHTNGIVAVVQKQQQYYGGTYDPYLWFKNWLGQWDLNRTFDVIKNMQHNKKAFASHSLSDNYIDIVTEDAFLRAPNKYIEEAFNKSQNLECYY